MRREHVFYNGVLIINIDSGGFLLYMMRSKQAVEQYLKN